MREGRGITEIEGGRGREEKVVEEERACKGKLSVIF